jgi:hypothetical protein
MSKSTATMHAQNADENHWPRGGVLLEPVPYVSRKIRAIRQIGETCGLARFVSAKTVAMGSIGTAWDLRSRRRKSKACSPVYS